MLHGRVGNRLILLAFFVFALHCAVVQNAEAQSRNSTTVRFRLPARAEYGGTTRALRSTHRLVIPHGGRLRFDRSLGEGVGIFLSRGGARLRLSSDFVITSFQVRALGDGVFRAWDPNEANTLLMQPLRAGRSYSLGTNWQAPLRWARFSWNPSGKNTRSQGVLVTSVTLMREVPTPTPTPTPHATATAPVEQPTVPPDPTQSPPATPTPFDPSACPNFKIEGFAANTRGGCGAPTYLVTSLEDPQTPIPGTFRFFAERLNGPRNIRFAVSGTIQLRTDVTVRSGDLTIDGSDAPAGGVQFSGATLNIEASNVILRNVRFLPGPFSLKPGQTDALRIGGEQPQWIERVVVDHCSLLWATDENLSIVGKTRDVTIQWSLIAEGLYLSTHPKKDPHSMGALLHREATRITMHHNLFAHNNYRNPQLASSGVLEWINNVVYNTRSAAGLLETPSAGVENQLDAIGNFNKLGPSSDWEGSRFRYSWRHGVVAGRSQLFLQGNLDWNRTSLSQPERMVAHPFIWSWIVQSRLVTDSQVTTTSAEQAYRDVLAGAGALLPCRSPVDKRIASETESGTGGFINYPSERGGWPDLSRGCE